MLSFISISLPCSLSMCVLCKSDENECIYIDNNFFNTLILSLSTLLLCSLKLYTCIFALFYSKVLYGVSRERMHKINYINCRNKLIIHTMYVLHIYFMCSSSSSHRNAVQRQPTAHIFSCVSE